MESYSRLSIIAEPGAYYCSSAFSLAAMIIGKRVDNFCHFNSNSNSNIQLDHNYNSHKHIHYYINDGVFGSFFGQLCGHPIIGKTSLEITTLLKDKKLATRKVYKSTIWGQTLASVDVVSEDIQFPEMNINEWILFKDVGDYSLSLLSQFCEFRPTRISYYFNNQMKKLFKIAQYY